MKSYHSLIALALLAGCTAPEKKIEEAVAVAPAAVALPASLEEAVQSEVYRSPENRLRDPHRRPRETLAFFGIKPEMTVVEVSPGAGWYTEILAPYLSSKGRYIAAAVPPGDSAYMKKVTEKFTAWQAQHPQVKVNTSAFDLPAQATIAPPSSADLVLTFRNVHNWMARDTQKAAFASFFAALKPGGVLGVVEHRAAPKGKQDPKAKSGYVQEAEVIRLAEQAGFKLEARSEINANPKDKRNHPKGVWTLPPSLSLGETDKVKYLAIGESDRMTLRFVKPAS